MINYDSDIVSNEEMKDNFHVIKKHLPIFKDKFDIVLRDTDGDASVSDLDRLIRESLEEGNLNFSEKRILNGFYETWMAIFMMVGSAEKSLEILFRDIEV
jgi:hypothetical protein